MKKDGFFRKLITLFLTFMKIGVTTFGGGYAMIPIINEEIINKKKWIRESEMLDIIAIAESTPGPIAVNTATYVGYKVAGFWGGLVATIGLAIPSFIIIFIISFFYKDFISWSWVSAIFKGLKIGVVILLILAVLRLRKNIKLSLVNIILFSVSFIGLLLLTFLQVNIPFTSLMFIALGIVTGVTIEAINKRKEKE